MTPWTVACQPPSSTGFSRQEHWSGLPFPSPDMRKASKTERIYTCITESGLPRWLRGKESAYQCGRHKRYGFDPWVWKIPWRRERLPTPVFWPRESLGLYIPWGHKELDTTKQLSQVVLQIIILNEVSQRKTTVI